MHSKERPLNGAPRTTTAALSSAPQWPTVCLWLIGNPVSGQGKGFCVISGIADALVMHFGRERVRTMTSVEFLSTFVVLGGEASSARGTATVDLALLRRTADEMNPTPYTCPCSREASARAGGGSRRARSGKGGGGNVCVFVVSTERAKDGVHVARAIAALNVHSRWRNQVTCSVRRDGEGEQPAVSDQWLHVVGVVGGDGSLSDAVNGLCQGTLATYRALTSPIRRQCQPQQQCPAAPPKATADTSSLSVTTGACRGLTAPRGASSPGIRGPGVVRSASAGAPLRCCPPSPEPVAVEVFPEGRSKADDAADEAATAVAVSSPLDDPFDEDVVATAVADAAASPSSSLRPPPPRSDSYHYYWQVARDKTTLRHLLPGMLYTPGGTGADFAKLRLCCTNAQETLSVFAGVVCHFLSQAQTRQDAPCGEGGGTPVTSHHGEAPQENRLESGSKGCCDRALLSYEVDIGRVTFAKSGHCRFFVNECSIGMSCDVVERGERFKRNRLMASLGGRVLFASSAAISLLRMAPRIVRLARLDPTPSLPFSSSSPLSGGLWSSSVVHHPHAAEQRVVAEGRLPLHLSSSDVAWSLVKLDEEFLLAEERRRWQQQQQQQQRHESDRLHHGCYRFFADARAASGPAALYAMPREKDLLPVSAEDDSCEAPRAGAPVFCRSPRGIRKRLDLPRGRGGDGEVDGEVDGEMDGEVDGEVDWVYCESSTWAFGNGRWYGGGMHVTPHANPTDGLLSCTNWVATVLPFVSGALSLYTGGHVKWRSTTALDGKRFVVDVGPLPEKVVQRRRAARANTRKEARVPSSPSATTAPAMDWADERMEMLMEADGELLEELPAVIELAGAITFFAPATELFAQLQASFGPPAPGTTRALLAEANPQRRGSPSCAGVPLLGPDVAYADRRDNGETADDSVPRPSKALAMRGSEDSSSIDGGEEEEVVPLRDCALLSSASSSTGDSVDWLPGSWRGLRRLFSSGQV